MAKALTDEEKKVKAEVAAKAKAEKDAATETSKSKLVYFRSSQYAGLTILKKDGSSVRFTVYFDTFKGDKVRVGFLATDDKEVIERCRSLELEEVTEKEFNHETVDAKTRLEKAPVYE